MSNTNDDVSSIHDSQEKKHLGMAFAKGLKGVCISLILIGSSAIVGAVSGLSKLAVNGLDSLATKLDRKKIINNKENDKPFLTRYYLLFRQMPSWMPFNVFIERYTDSDSGDLHDHPWGYFTFILSGGYWEHIYVDDDRKRIIKVWREAGYCATAPATHEKCISLSSQKGQCWTITICFRRDREWGFYRKTSGNSPVWVKSSRYLQEKKEHRLSTLEKKADSDSEYYSDTSDVIEQTIRRRKPKTPEHIRHRSPSPPQQDPLSMSLE